MKIKCEHVHSVEACRVTVASHFFRGDGSGALYFGQLTHPRSHHMSCRTLAAVVEGAFSQSSRTSAQAQAHVGVQLRKRYLHSAVWKQKASGSGARDGIGFGTKTCNTLSLSVGMLLTPRCSIA